MAHMFSDDELEDLLRMVRANRSGDSNTTFPRFDLLDPSVSDDIRTRDLLTYYVSGIACMTVSALGLIGNILSLVTLTRKVFSSSTYSYLSALAVCDSLFLICTMILVSKDAHHPSSGDEEYWSNWTEGLYPHMFPYVHALAFNFQVTSIWLTLAFTVDRYIMICHPFRSASHCTLRRARMVIVGLCTFSFLGNIPKFFEYEVVTWHVP